MEQQIDLPHLKARYRQWKQQQQEKTADSRDLDLEINKIRYTLLTYAGQMKDV
jgi:hypothetical protein